MSHAHRLAEARSGKWRRKATAVLPRRAVLATDGPYTAFGVSTRNADVVLVLHFFSKRVVSTFALPVGVLADLHATEREAMAMSFLRRSKPAPAGASSGVEPPSMWKHDFPALCEYLFSETYPDGQRRQRATVTVMAGDAVGVKVVLNDRQEGRSLWATGDDLDGCLLSLEALLQTEVTPWRLDKQVSRVKNGKPS